MYSVGTGHGVKSQGGQDWDRRVTNKNEKKATGFDESNP